MEATLDTNEVRVWKRYDKYQVIDTAWITTAPEHWKFQRLKWTIDGCQNGIWGGEPTGEDGEDLGCVRVADFDRDNLVVTDGIELTTRSIPVSKREGRQLVRGDLLLEKSGGGDLQPVGAVVLFDSDAEAVCSNFVAKVSVPDNYSSSFLRYLHAGLYSARVNKRSLKQSTGIQNLDSDQYFDEKMALPPHEEQRAIAAFLDRETARIDALIGHKERLIALLEEKRQAVISHAVTRGIDPNAKMKDSGIEWIGQVPEHWKVLKGRWLGDLVPSRGYTELEQNDGKESLPFFKVDDLNTDAGQLDLDSSKGHAIPDTRVTDSGEVILFPKRGAAIFTNKVRVVNDPILFDPNLMAWSINPKYEVRFVAYGLLSRGLSDLADISSVPQINNKHVYPAQFPAPPRDEQKEIVEYIEHMRSGIAKLLTTIHESIARLHEYRTALISAAVTGQIDVRGEVELDG